MKVPGWIVQTKTPAFYHILSNIWCDQAFQTNVPSRDYPDYPPVTILVLTHHQIRETAMPYQKKCTSVQWGHVETWELPAFPSEVLDFS